MVSTLCHGSIKFTQGCKKATNVQLTETLTLSVTKASHECWVSSLSKIIPGYNEASENQRHASYGCCIKLMPASF